MFDRVLVNATHEHIGHPTNQSTNLPIMLYYCFLSAKLFNYPSDWTQGTQNEYVLLFAGYKENFQRFFQIRYAFLNLSRTTYQIHKWYL